VAVKRIAVMTSGGDTPGMNAAIRAVARIGAYHGLEVLGIQRGYQGMIDDEFSHLGPRSVSNIIQNGGTILRTARSKEFMTLEGRRKAADNLTRRGVDGVVLIGGNGTFTGAIELAKIWQGGLVGAPGTIDNDLYGSDFTIGFDTAVNTVTEAIDKIRDTMDAHERIFVIEVMGRHAGFIALAVGIGGGAEEILIPETPTNMPAIVERIERNIRRGKRSNLIVVAEGDENGGASVVVEALNKQGFDARACILGHLQRGGRPTASDRMLATRTGAACVDALIAGRTGVMAGVVNGVDTLTPFEDAVFKRKPIPRRVLELAERLAT